MTARYSYTCIIWLLLLLIIQACKKGEVLSAQPLPNPAVENPVTLSTDKASYKPGETITFTADKPLPATAKIRYKQLNHTVAESSIAGTSWNWTAPATDFTGYLAEVYNLVNGEEKILGTVAIDVSSDWTKFPRYGFLSKFPQMNQQEIEAVIANLNRHHINGIQFYDWHYKHHQPLAGSAASPEPVWKDIINRDIYFSTVQQYIETAHRHNMKAMFYNLVYGALKDAAADGVAEEWYVYKDRTHTTKDKHPLPAPPFISDIFLLNPANTGWQQYLIQEHRKVYAALPFDGFHMDQLGNRNHILYDYDGTVIDLATTYAPFIEASKAGKPEKDLVMNAVNQYGQEGIASSPVSFLYSEVWDPNNSFADLAKIITDNYQLSKQAKNSVLAAYMNYNLADNKGTFNTPAVLLANAVIFAFGGAHLELGEHMLGKEYFPNDNLSMKEDLKKALVPYYDFLVAYQNLLRDGGTFNNPSLTAVANKISLNSWPPQQGQVAVVGKEQNNRQVVHLLNFTNATTLEWRDSNGSQAYPLPVENIGLHVQATKPVERVWYATPDADKAAARSVEFTQSGSQVSFTLPYLQYWTMIVIEYQ